MRVTFAVRAVALLHLTPNKYGLTVDRLFSQKITAVNGKSFTNASAAQSGGHGATIAPPPHSKNLISPPLCPGKIATGLTCKPAKSLRAESL